jgi:membrane protease YdiL (CAAX protease family)
MHRGSSFRLHGWICWGLIAGSWIALAAGTYDAMADLDLLIAEIDWREPEYPKPPAVLIAIFCAVVALFLAVCLSRRGRTWLRMRHRPSRLSTHGDTYLEAFTLRFVAAGLGMAGFQLIGWHWKPLLFLGMLGSLVAILYAFARCRSIRIPLADWGWRGHRGVWLDISIGVLLGFMYPGLVSEVTNASLVSSMGVLGFLRGVVWTPIVEETLYRGMLYRYLRDRWRWPVAVVVSAAVFAAMHLPLSRAPYALAGGIVYALLREWRGSLVAPIAAHAATSLLFILRPMLLD